jgi:hypothetical protein
MKKLFAYVILSGLIVLTFYFVVVGPYQLCKEYEANGIHYVYQ